MWSRAMRIQWKTQGAWVILGISLALVFTSGVGFSNQKSTHTLTILYTSNTNALLEACR